MSIRILALAFLIAASSAIAAPPQSAQQQPPPTDEQSSNESIDVDAIARSKDVGANGEAAAPEQAAAPTQDTSAEPPPAPEESATPPAAPAEPAAPPVAPEPATPAAAKPVSPEVAAEKSIAASCQAHATSLLDDAQKADFAGATRSFDAKMRTSLPPPKLKEAWDSLSRFGKLKARGQSHIGKGEGYLVVMIPLIFDKANLVAQIACGSDGRIAGFYVKPLPMPTPAS